MQRRFPYEAFASAVSGRRQGNQAKLWNLPQSNHSPFGNGKAMATFEKPVARLVNKFPILWKSTIYYLVHKGP
jgi:hypothetical protein